MNTLGTAGTSESLVVDVGGSKTRFAISRSGEVGPIHSGKFNSYDQLIASLRTLSPSPNAIAISVPGFVNHEKGYVRLSRNAPWLEGDLRKKLSLSFPGARVLVHSDGEAHALAMNRLHRLEVGAISVALGTAVAFGALDREGKIYRPLSGENWDIGDLTLHTSASTKEVWSALGTPGFDSLMTKDPHDGPVQFGYRLGALLVHLTILFQPRTIALSGGLVREHWDEIENSAKEELRHVPAHLHQPSLRPILVEEAALEGLAWLLSKYEFGLTFSWSEGLRRKI